MVFIFELDEGNVVKGEGDWVLFVLCLLSLMMVCLYLVDGVLGINWCWYLNVEF